MDRDSFKKLQRFFEQFKLLSYQKRETILRADDNPLGVFYLHKGYVRLYALSKEGQELTLIIFKPQDFFPIVWAVNDAPNEYYYEALTQVELWRAPREAFVAFIKQHPDVLFLSMSRILVRFMGLLRRMEYLVFGNAYEKVASILFICAERFGKKVKMGTLIQVPLTHREVASLVGITRETASLEMKKLETKGIIGYRGRLLVIKSSNRLLKESLFSEQ